MDTGLLLSHGTRILERSGIENARGDAERLLCSLLGKTRTELYLKEKLNDPVIFDSFFRMIEERKGRVPLQHLLRSVDFMGYELAVTRDTFIPRFETEMLVESLVEGLRTSPEGVYANRLKIVEIGTGSGNIAIALTKMLDVSKIWALDISRAALAVASQNAVAHRVAERIEFIHANFLSWRPPDSGRFEVMVSNPPYIARSEIAALSPEVLYDPRVALDGGETGVEFIEKLIERAGEMLVSGGMLCIEIGAGQGPSVGTMIEKTRFLTLLRIESDYRGIPRVLFARRR